MNTAEMKKMARAFGADLVGVAPIEAFRNQPAENNPFHIFPKAKCMIVIGRRILRGSLRGLESNAANGSAFRHFGFGALEDNYLAKTTYDLTIWIEAQGFEAVPMFGYDVEMTAKQPLAVSVAPGEKPAANVYVDWKFAAQAAGLGAVGRHGLFLTPEFGPLQRFAMLLSDFEFETDAPFAGDFCSGCDACAAECPSKALDGATRCDELCRTCKTGAVNPGWGRFNTVERIGAACGRGCFAALERRGLLRKKYARKFREEVAK